MKNCVCHDKICLMTYDKMFYILFPLRAFLDVLRNERTIGQYFKLMFFGIIERVKRKLRYQTFSPVFIVQFGMKQRYHIISEIIMNHCIRIGETSFKLSMHV